MSAKFNQHSKKSQSNVHSDDRDRDGDSESNDYLNANGDVRTRPREREPKPSNQADSDEEEGQISQEDNDTEVREFPDAESVDQRHLQDQTSQPPLPDEAPPEDDGWEPIWDGGAQAFYFYNRFSGISQWENPRVPEAAGTTGTTATTTKTRPAATSSTSAPALTSTSEEPVRRHGGYNPAIHGDYDPNADYARLDRLEEEERHQQQLIREGQFADPSLLYMATGSFNRYTGKWQAEGLTPENFDDEHKSRRQLNAFFDVDAAANSHDGRSLKAERAGRKLTKKELKAFKEKRREKKEEKRRAWLRD